MRTKRLLEFVRSECCRNPREGGLSPVLVATACEKKALSTQSLRGLGNGFADMAERRSSMAMIETRMTPTRL